MTSKDVNNDLNMQELKSKISELLDIYLTYDFTTTFFYIAPILRHSHQGIEAISSKEFNDYINMLQKSLSNINSNVGTLIVNNLKTLREATEDLDIENELLDYLKITYCQKRIALKITYLYNNFFNRDISALVAFLATTQPEISSDKIDSLFNSMDKANEENFQENLYSLKKFIFLIREEKDLSLFVKGIITELIS